MSKYSKNYQVILKMTMKNLGDYIDELEYRCLVDNSEFNQLIFSQMKAVAFILPNILNHQS